MQVRDHTGEVIGTCHECPDPDAYFWRVPSGEVYRLAHHTQISREGEARKWRVVRVAEGQSPERLPGWVPLRGL